MNHRKPLSATFCRTVKTLGVYGDGRGGYGLSLRVRVRANGRLSKYFLQRVRIGGRATNLGLGAYPVVTLAEARKAALENRRSIAQGRDPRGAGIPTFTQAAEKVIRLHRKNWSGERTEAQWRNHLLHHAAPLGAKRVDKIQSHDILGVLAPLWGEKATTARLVYRRIGSVMRWSIARGYRPDDPCTAVSAALPRNGAQKVHHRALPHADVVTALDAIRDASTWLATRLAVEFVALTATRNGEVRGADWDEFDLRAKVWTIPAARMKTRQKHRVPLSLGALQVLGRARDEFGDQRLVFPSTRGRKLTRAELGRLVRRLGIDTTIHGFRSSFRDWCAETSVDRQVAEAALAHIVGGVEGAYLRSDLFERRRDVMESWSSYLGNRVKG